MLRVWQNLSTALELNDGQLSESCYSGYPKWLYKSARPGITLEAFAEVTIFPAGNRDARS